METNGSPERCGGWKAPRCSAGPAITRSGSPLTAVANEASAYVDVAKLVDEDVDLRSLLVAASSLTVR